MEDGSAAGARRGAALSGALPEARWVKPPRFRQDSGAHRQATWLELFFDLVFVVAIAGLAGLLREDLSLKGLAYVGRRKNVNGDRPS